MPGGSVAVGEAAPRAAGDGVAGGVWRVGNSGVSIGAGTGVVAVTKGRTVAAVSGIGVRAGPGEADSPTGTVGESDAAGVPASEGAALGEAVDSASTVADGDGGTASGVAAPTGRGVIVAIDGGVSGGAGEAVSSGVAGRVGTSVAVGSGLGVGVGGVRVGGGG